MTTFGSPQIAALLGLESGSVQVNRLVGVVFDRHPGVGFALKLSAGEMFALMVAHALVRQHGQGGDFHGRRTYESTRPITRLIVREYDLGKRPRFMLIDDDGPRLLYGPRSAEQAVERALALASTTSTIVRLGPMLDAIDGLLVA